LADPEWTVLACLVILEFKHLVFDFFLQTPYQLRTKGIYGHPGGILHAGLQAAGTLPALLLFSPSFGLVVAIVLGEFVIHYHIDWTKEQVMKWRGYRSHDSGFWYALGTDQFLHQLTYVGILAVLLGATE
jgi:hypothetical protein